uniref:Uncharacterized protein n=1 Tax=Glossina pallidipes TaxID=7398 RepID=A0A1B0AEZ0_GLOPL
MLVHSTNSSSTPTPGSTSSATNTLEPPARSTTTTSNTSTNSSNHHHLPPSQMTNSPLNSRPPSRAPSILDSPTLARVERARLRLEASSQQQHLNGSCGSSINTLNRENSLERKAMDSKPLRKWALFMGRLVTITGNDFIENKSYIESVN